MAESCVRRKYKTMGEIAYEAMRKNAPEEFQVDMPVFDDLPLRSKKSWEAVGNEVEEETLDREQNKADQAWRDKHPLARKLS